MDEEIEKIERRNRIENGIYTWGLVVFFAVTIGLLAKMFISAL